MSSKIKKAVFPVAGLGVRFLPATKANPKEMMPIVDKPLVQYAAEEAAAAGIADLIFITGRMKHSISDHFDKAYELEAELERGNKHEMLQIVRNILPPEVTCIYIRQAEPLGLGHAVLQARSVVGQEPFAVLLADDLIANGSEGCLKRMIDIFEANQSSVLAVEQVQPQDTNKYGIVAAEPIENRLSRVVQIVEKPKPQEAPSTLAVVGRYIFTPAIFDCLKRTGQGAGGEIQLTDAIAKLLELEPVLAYEFEGKRYDCGSKLGYLQATVEYALRHPELKDAFASYLRSMTFA
ncbi:MAG: UTP--glucose-1-phosphate uridylyltransferase GalU [Gammaproteobacteria bacterium]|nr:UTP--glucose-1-phosphate uridylyltransferase GalU [Gammaproteobacteria bacterium]